jgi:hypothetical protein
MSCYRKGMVVGSDSEEEEPVLNKNSVLSLRGQRNLRKLKNCTEPETDPKRFKVGETTDTTADTKLSLFVAGVKNDCEKNNTILRLIIDAVKTLNVRIHDVVANQAPCDFVEKILSDATKTLNNNIDLVTSLVGCNKINMEKQVQAMKDTGTKISTMQKQVEGLTRRINILQANNARGVSVTIELKEAIDDADARLLAANGDAEELAATQTQLLLSKRDNDILRKDLAVANKKAEDTRIVHDLMLLRITCSYCLGLVQYLAVMNCGTTACNACRISIQMKDPVCRWGICTAVGDCGLSVITKCTVKYTTTPGNYVEDVGKMMAIVGPHNGDMVACPAVLRACLAETDKVREDKFTKQTADAQARLDANRVAVVQATTGE